MFVNELNFLSLKALDNYYNQVNKLMAMKRILSLIIVPAIILGVVSCSKVDELDDRLSNLEDRMDVIEDLCSNLNENISSLQIIVEALQENDFITSVSPIVENGETIGYLITFAKNGTITIYNGKDGVDGIDGYIPQIGVKQDTDGIYYWTIDDEWLLDDSGNKIKAQGNDGKDGIIPQFKIEDGRWFISVDNGKTWSDIGQATGDSFFKDIEVTDSAVIFTLANGEEFIIERAATLSIKFEVDDLVVMDVNSTRSVRYTIESESDEIDVEVISSSDIKAKVTRSGLLTGTVDITTGQTIDEYSKVVVFVSDGTQVKMRTIHFEKAGLEIIDSSIKEISNEGGTVDLEFMTNIECHAEIPEEASSWISLTVTKSMERQSISLQITPNLGEDRQATVIIAAESSDLSLIYTIKQSADPSIQIQSEREALIAFYKATNGDNWIRKDNWCSDRPLNEWYGIYTNDKGYVKEIILPANRMSGKLPDEIGVFTELERLDLGISVSSEDPNNNAVSGQIPVSIGNLVKLRSLILSCNDFAGSIPEEIGNLVKLQELRLDHNRLSGNIPECIGNLCDLYNLDLGVNELSGNIPASIGNLTNLTNLTLFYNQLSGEIPSEIGNLVQLQSLILLNNNLTGNIPEGIGNLVELRTVSLQSNQLSGEIPYSIGNLTKLERLSLSSNALSGEIPESIGNMESLRSFDIGNYSVGAGGGTVIPGQPTGNMNQISGEIPESFYNLKNLDDFGAIFNCLSGELSDKLWSMPSLRCLALSGNKFTGTISPAISNAKNLYQLWLENNLISGPIPEEICNLPNLEELLIGNSTSKIDGTSINEYNRFEGNIPENIGNLSKLRQLSLANCGLTGNIPESICKLADLEFFNVGNVTSGKVFNDITGVIPEEIGNLKQLQSFSVMENNMTGNVPVAFANMQNLTSLMLCGNRLSGTIPKELLQCANWNTWNPDVWILPQQVGYVLYLDQYVSSDFSHDGEIMELQRASKGNGIDVVLLGDGFVDTDMTDGDYEQVMETAVKHLFSVEPMSSLRDYFNVFAVKAVSKNEGIVSGGETVFGSKYGDGTLISGDDAKCMEYASKIEGIDLGETLIVVILNDTKYAGTAYMYDNNLGIAYCPIVDGLESEGFAEIIHHEAIGHGFAKLADEYFYEYMGTIPQDLVVTYSEQKENGWWANADFTNDPAAVSWNSFISDGRYSAEGLSVYEGAFTYPKGAFRPTEYSIMNENVGGFNVPSRNAIYKRAVELAGEEYRYEQFLEYDEINRRNEAITASRSKAAIRSKEKFIPLHPPVVKEYKEKF